VCSLPWVFRQNRSPTSKNDRLLPVSHFANILFRSFSIASGVGWLLPLIHMPGFLHRELTVPKNRAHSVIEWYYSSLAAFLLYSMCAPISAALFFLFQITLILLI